ncbi:hypothetical protein AB0D66_32670 [Streptomyces sp. NPDC048270]|uniref:hypothetical protein n=1 Tax=Streptomyces sp. NPDC048270 TaxID=3154615 RepID=UPI0033F3F629
MATPASVFRPTPVEKPEQEHEVCLSVPDQPMTAVDELMAPRLPALLPSPRLPVDESQIKASEFEALLSPIGRLCLPGGQQMKFPAALG